MPHPSISEKKLHVSVSCAGPVEGVSYASIKAGAVPDVPSAPLAATPAASPKVPPPPVAPGDRKFTLQALGEVVSPGLSEFHLSMDILYVKTVKIYIYM